MILFVYLNVGLSLAGSPGPVFGWLEEVLQREGKTLHFAPLVKGQPSSIDLL